ncbi:hypothetical protein Naga_100294g9 [Nannochloropsis gaditana]|uniref:Uncharacterized protein n=1 Tax=Nannochloropsis gaditana TaxID=72520 RepID=W7TW33_9STRA|nr:hypothetical protein Naga_100294g9 [Nannochloropsis gaditana]
MKTVGAHQEDEVLPTDTNTAYTLTMTHTKASSPSLYYNGATTLPCPSWHLNTAEIFPCFASVEFDPGRQLSPSRSCYNVSFGFYKCLGAASRIISSLCILNVFHCVYVVPCTRGRTS